MKRRTLLQNMAACGCLTALGQPMMSARILAAGSALDTRQLTTRVSLINGAGGNVVHFQGDQGITLVDSGDKSNTDALLAQIDALSANSSDSSAVRNLFNTHWHEDHTGGNEAFHALGTRIISHENTRLWLNAEFDVEWRNLSHHPRPAAALPDMTFYESGLMDLDGEVVQFHYYPQAHTDGDIALLFPDSNVLVTGGLLSDGTYPIPDIATGGWIGGLIEANEAMLELVNDDTIIIPERGPERSKADLQAQLAMLTDLYEQMKVLARQGFSGHDMLEEGVTADYDSQWGNPEEFVLETYRGMWAHTYDMGGFI